MLNITSQEIENILGIKLNSEFQITGISTDSRNIKQGDLYVPLIGEKFNGHDFIKVCIQNGAVLAFCNFDEYEKRKYEIADVINQVMIVDSNEKAYYKIMQYWRDKFRDVKCIAIGGSVGKTTTKELLRAICEADGETVFTKENYNNTYGMCIVVNELKESTKYLVCELGIDKRGELEIEASIAKPNIGVCLSVTATHASLLGGKIDDVANAESELVKYFRNTGTILLNLDDTYVKLMRPFVNTSKVLTFGKENTNQSDIYVTNFSQDISGIKLDLNILNNIFVPKLWGTGNLYNIMAAVGIAKELGISDENILRGIKNFINIPHRLNFFTYNQNITIQDDSYNANPQSMKQSIEVFNQLAGDNRKIYVLGDMRELGEHADEEHQKLVELIKQNKPDGLFYIGDYKNLIKDSLKENATKFTVFDNISSEQDLNNILDTIKKQLKPNDWVLIKASKGTGVYKIAQEFQK